MGEIFRQAPGFDFLWIVVDSLALKVAEDEEGTEYEIGFPEYVVDSLRQLYPNMQDYGDKLAEHVLKISLQEKEGLSYAFVRARNVFFMQANVVQGQPIDPEHLRYSLGILLATLHDQRPARILFALPEPPEEVAEKCPRLNSVLTHEDFQVTVVQWTLP